MTGRPGARRRAGASALAAFLVAFALCAGSARAELKKWQEPAPAYVPPGAQLGAAPEPTPDKPITQRWWFWTAVGAAVVTTVVVIVVATREPSPPASTLGNMDAFMGK